MRLVVVESPLAGKTPADFARNIRYARLACLDCLQRGEAPFASHLLYPQMLDDRVQAHRALGMRAGFAWGELCKDVVVFTDFGISPGMRASIERAEGLMQHVEYRKLGGELMHRLLLDDAPDATPGAT